MCGHERYKGGVVQGRNIPHKKMHDFPFTPRLQRLFMSQHIAFDMRWHKDQRVEIEDFLQHLAEGEAWKDFDKQFLDFAVEPRNVRLGLATDGFNPFSDMSNTYSIWPVFSCPTTCPTRGA